jgi:membrane protease subunit (stomatin/prohibitin family)
LGDLDQYMRFKVANAIGDSAKNEGLAGNAFNTSTGLALGMLLPGIINTGIASAVKPPIDSMEKLRKLKELLELGAITQSEFSVKKAQLMNEF